MLKAGIWVVFDEDDNGRCCSYLEHKDTNTRTAIHDNNGSFQFTIKVPKGEGGVNQVSVGVADNERKGFPRPGSLVADLFY